MSIWHGRRKHLHAGEGEDFLTWSHVSRENLYLYGQVLICVWLSVLIQALYKRCVCGFWGRVCMCFFWLDVCLCACVCVCVCVHVVVLGDPTLSAPSEGEGAEVTGSPQVHAGHGHVWRGESQQDGSGQEKGLAQVVGYVYHQWVLLARQHVGTCKGHKWMRMHTYKKSL